MHPHAAIWLARHRRLLAVGLCLFVCFVLSSSLALAMGLLDEAVDPLPQGCIGATPPGDNSPLCCLSGFVYVQGEAVANAEIKILNARGDIVTAHTTSHQGLEHRPYFYFDLPKLNIHTLNGTRPITPTDVITLQVSYHGVTESVAYTVQPGGQNLRFNLYKLEIASTNLFNSSFMMTFCRFARLDIYPVDTGCDI